MQSILDLREFAEFTLSVIRWFVQPHVLPLAGAVAAVASAFAVNPWEWVRSPFKSLGWALRVVVVWLIIVWLIGSAIGGRGTSTGSQGSGTQTAAVQSESAGGQLQSGGVAPQRFGPLNIRFLSLTDNPALARPFCCQLAVGDRTETVEATSMAGMKEQFKSKLDVLAKTRPFASVILEKAPFPGESVRDSVADWLHEHDPAIEVDLATPSPKESRR